MCTKHIHSLNEIPYVRWQCLPTRVIDYITKTRYENSSLKLLLRVLQEDPKSVETIAIALSCFLEVKGKSLLQKTTCNLDTRAHRPELDLILKLSLWGLAFMIPTGTMQAFYGGKQPRNGIHKVKQQPELQNIRLQ